ncbi:phasin family protein [Pseudomonas helleri]|uniref:Phasin domain-containing protein n=1 Tax=Pseudomonas helleri TaxID=1608996 RepID=A0A6L5I1P1_9PSED|nr:phasin family protein [Pseudomonas helleri]MQU09546.1 hypothetical protein [Pseudomonas helleri]
MSTENTIPLNLFKANLELQLRINRLLQENSQRWLDIASRAGTESVAESNAELENLLKANNWQALATLPGESFWRQLQQRIGDAQASAQVAISAQTAFTTGLQQAIQGWQKANIEAVGGGVDATLPFNDLFKQWGAVWASATASDGKPAKGGASRG